MIFDLFHSVSDPEISGRRLGAGNVFKNFLDQVHLAEEIGMDTVWLAESHFSSEAQKSTSVGTIPNFHGEVGLNTDSFQWLNFLAERTEKINFGTAIHNIVGGSGGPIASADRVNALRFINSQFRESARRFRIGVAAGRFPYQNTPFGIVPRDDFERDFWPIVRRLVFIEALEIFLRLLNGEEFSSEQVSRHSVTVSEAEKVFKDSSPALVQKYPLPRAPSPRWEFESLKLVPDAHDRTGVEIILGSSDPDALETALLYHDVGLFNLSFTPPDQIEKLHARMIERCKAMPTQWHRSRLPRTVMVFIDPDGKKARARANFVLDTYIEAMRGTAAVPNKAVLLERALVGDAAEIRDQLSPENARGFHPEDRLMLWFEFNQQNPDEITEQMKYFFNAAV